MKTRRATVSFKTVGCRLNQAETAIIRASFEEAGFATVRFGEACDVCVVHGCVVTARAEEDSARLVRSIKHRYPDAFVILVGCAAELLTKESNKTGRTGQADMATPFCHPERSEGSRQKCQIANEIPRPDLKRVGTRNDKLHSIEIPTRVPVAADFLAGQKEKFNLPEILGRRFQTAEKQLTRISHAPREKCARRAEVEALCASLRGRPEATFRLLRPAPMPSKVIGRPVLISQPDLGCEISRLTPPLPLFSTKRAIVKIQDGCDFRCSYCIVPSVRGPGWSRPSAEIIEEITRLILCGFPEIVLTGANIGCYDENGLGLAQLLEKVEAIPGLKRFRISSLELSNVQHEHNTLQFPTASEKIPVEECLSFPSLLRRSKASGCEGWIKSGIQEKRLWIPTSVGMTDKIQEVIDFLAVSGKICRYLHLPLQSGSNRILQAMGRRYTAEKYCDTVEYARRKFGSFGLGTDIIVGFPGETEEDFMETEQIVQRLPFTNLHVFNYSPRPGTPAALMSDQVSIMDKEKRVKKLIELGGQKRRDFAQSFVGQQISIVVEKIKNGWAEGWTGEYMWARIRSNDLKPRQIVSFVCRSVADDVLAGTLA